MLQKHEQKFQRHQKAVGEEPHGSAPTLIVTDYPPTFINVLHWYKPEELRQMFYYFEKIFQFATYCHNQNVKAWFTIV